MNVHRCMYGAIACAIVASSTAQAEFFGFGVERYTVNTATGTFEVADVFAYFDNPATRVTGVLDMNVSLGGAANWYHNDALGTNFGGGAGGTWRSNVPSFDLADSFLTVGGDGPAFAGPVNSTVFDAGFLPGPNDNPLFAGYFNSNPPNSQGLANDNAFHPSGYSWLHATMVGRFSIPAQAAPAEFDFSACLTWNTGLGTPTSIDCGSISVPVDYVCAPGPGTRLLVLLDRTGSMLDINPVSGLTYCAEAEFAALQNITVFSLTDPLGLVDIWTFAGNSATELTAGFVTPAVANAALGGVGACAGATPLADAVCMSVDALLQSCADDGESLRLLILTDGEENNSTGPCSGPPSVEQPPPSGDYDAGSWHDHVYEWVTTNGIEATVWLWEPAPFPSGSNTVSDKVFFDDLSGATGGYFVFIPFGTAPPLPVGACCGSDGSCSENQTVFQCIESRGLFQGIASTCEQCGTKSPCAGDFDGNNAVDASDLAVILGAWGTVNPAIDLNGGGVIDGGDLAVLLGAWGPCAE